MITERQAWGAVLITAALLVAFDAYGYTLQEVGDALCQEHPTNAICSTPDPNEPIPGGGEFLPDLPDGGLVKLNDVTCSGPETGNLCEGWVGFGSFTCEGRICYGMGGGHSGTMTDTVFRLDLNNPQWTEMYPPTPCEIQGNTDNINHAHRSYTYQGHERPMSTHSYDLLGIHGGYLYHMGGRGAAGAWKRCSSTTHNEVMRANKDPASYRIVRMNLQTLQWEWTDSLWGAMPKYYTAGYPGSVVVGDNIHIYGMGSHYIYNPIRDTKTLVGRGPTGYEVSVVNADGVIYGVGHAGNTFAVSKAKPDGNPTTEGLIPQGCGIKNHWGFEWDSRNKVLGKVEDGKYKFYNPDKNVCGQVKIPGADSALRVAYHGSQIVEGVYVFISSLKETLAYRIPDVSSVPPDNYGGTATINGVEYPNLTSASKALKDGETMILSPGTYLEAIAITASGVTITGCGAHLKDVSIGGKGAIITQGDDITIDCLEISGISVSDKNGAAVRHEGCGLTLSNVNFHDNENGLLTGYDSCTTAILNSEFRHNGTTGGRTHNLYVNSEGFLFKDSKSLAARYGHELKSRAKVTTITGSTLDSEDSPDSRLVDIPCGGEITMVGNSFRQGPQSLNRGVIGVDWEPCHHPKQSFIFESNAVDIQANHVLFDKVRPDGQ